MASWQARQRDPLLDQNTQAMLERRGRELMGIALLVVAFGFFLMFASYSPTDPGWMVATDQPAHNLLGRFGAAVASTLIIIVGKGVWSLPVLFLAWGARFVSHRGADRAIARVVFAVIAVALCSVFAASLVPSTGWPHTFGLGGLFGDTVLGTMLGVAPGSAGVGLTILSLILFVAMTAMMLFVTGFDLAELRAIQHFLIVAAVKAYNWALIFADRGAAGAGRAAAGAGRAAADWQGRRREKQAIAAERQSAAQAMAARHQAPAQYARGRAAQSPSGATAAPAMAPAPMSAAMSAARGSIVRRAPQPSYEDEADYEPELIEETPQSQDWGRASPLRADPRHTDPRHTDPRHTDPRHADARAQEPRYSEPLAEAAHYTQPREKLGLLSRVPGLGRLVGEPQPELVETEIVPLSALDMPPADRIKSRISEAVRSRTRAPEAEMTPLQAAILNRREPPIARPRGPVPLIADTRRSVPPTPTPLAERVEPPVMAPVVAPMTAAATSAAALASSAARAAVAQPAPARHSSAALAEAPAAQGFAAPARADQPRADHSRADHARVEPPLAAAKWHDDSLELYDEEWDEDDAHLAPAPVNSLSQAALNARDAGRSGLRAESDAQAAYDSINSNRAVDAYGDDEYGADAEYGADDGFDDDEIDALSWQPETAAKASAAVRVAPPVAPEARRVVQPSLAARRPALSTRAVQEAQPGLRFEESQHEYELPPLSLLTNPDTIQRHMLANEALEENARMLESVLDDYGVKGEIVSVRPGPVVTMYELEPAPGLKASRVIGLADDIARSMSALSARVSTVPGRSVIGIELPNTHREKVVLREIIASRDFDDKQVRLPLALGKDIGGDPIVANLAKMPHLLIAGTTGSGKSVAINTMILSLLYRLTPEECRLIMIDPKMLELSVYDGIPHLLSPVVTDPKKAVVALKWVVGEMEERYRKMSKMGVRNIEGYNGRVREALDKGELFKRTIQTGFDEETGDPVFETEEFAPQPFPYIVVIVDEMADLMMVAGKEIEACIQRLAQMARASGIHLIMATQRPSVDVITGTIKANFPTRISFQVTSKIDSRTILGEQGAEQLLGMGDMLYMAGGGRISRIHGPFVSDEEVEEIVNHLKSFGPPQYMSGVVEGPDEERADDIDAVLGLNTGGNTEGEDALYDQAVAIVAKDRKCSTSYIQRKLGIGYNKAARLVEQMEDQGIVTQANHVGKREILIPET